MPFIRHVTDSVLCLTFLSLAAIAVAPRPRRLGTLTQAAEHYRVSARTIRRRIATGELTGYRLPGTRSVRVDLDELDELLVTIPTTGKR